MDSERYIESILENQAIKKAEVERKAKNAVRMAVRKVMGDEKKLKAATPEQLERIRKISRAVIMSLFAGAGAAIGLNWRDIVTFINRTLRDFS
jgi:hypothetical protein